MANEESTIKSRHDIMYNANGHKGHEYEHSEAKKIKSFEDILA